MTETLAFSAMETDGVLAGPVRRPANASRFDKGTIHDDATAQTLGFKGGTVAGSIHMEQFPPLLLQAFGPDWARTGGLSLFFLNATTDGEPVQAFCGPPVARAEGGYRAEVWMIDTSTGQRVCEGTASVGPPDLDSHLRQRLKTVRPPGELRLLTAPVRAQVTEVPARLALAYRDGREALITEPLAAYSDPAEFGETVAIPSRAIHALREVEVPLWRPTVPYVGLFGAIELQMLAGPVFVEHDYLCDGQVLALSDSPKTEVVWYESTLKEPGGQAVARMILMSRLVKASAKVWG